MDVEQGVTLVFISVLNYYLRVQNKGIDYVKVIRIYMDGIRVNYQLDANIVYFSSTCFGPIRSSSGAIEFIISFTNAAYGVLGALLGVGLEECVC